MNAKLTICYDNTTLGPNYESAWGFACVLEFPQETILFDTGGDANILLHNLAALNISNDNFDKIIISHKDWDHIGGLEKMVALNPKAALYLPVSAQEVELEIDKQRIIWINEAMQINKYIYSLGEMPGARNEHSIVLPTTDGLVVITGCAHPGIVEIIKRAQKEFPQEKIELAIGGFHLKAMNQEESLTIVNMLEKSVNRISPTHCTGDDAILQFQSVFGPRYVPGGIGRSYTIEIEDIKNE